MIPTLVFGGGGLLGRAIMAAAPDARRAVVRWGSDDALDDIRAAVRGFAVALGGDRSWRVIWAAGRGVIASTEEELRAETASLEVALASIASGLPPGPDGRVILISSAGGLYAGSDRPPFDEDTRIAPLSPYGKEKAAQESALAVAVGRTGIDGVAVRLGPVYGALQDPSKSQGLVSALCRAAMTRRPVRLYVPLETRRSYVWVGDAGRLVADLSGRSSRENGAFRVRTIPGGPSVTIHELIATVHRVTRRPPPCLVAPGPEAAGHARDLRLATAYPSETTLADPTPLTVGIGRIWRAMLRDPVDPDTSGR